MGTGPPFGQESVSLVDRFRFALDDFKERFASPLSNATENLEAGQSTQAAQSLAQSASFHLAALAHAIQQGQLSGKIDKDLLGALSTIESSDWRYRQKAQYQIALLLARLTGGSMTVEGCAARSPLLPRSRGALSEANIVDLIGNTPIVAGNFLPQLDGDVLFKLEKYNPAGSVKDRVARYVVDQAESRGWLSPGGVLVESSSGNLGIALALIGSQRGYRVIIVVDPNTSKQNIAIMRAYGAEIVIETERDDTGNYHKTKLARARKIAEREQGGYWVNQTANELNAEAHCLTTGAEIVKQTARDLDFCVIATSSGGQVAGIAAAVTEHIPGVRVVAVDVIGSQIFNRQGSQYLTPGLGLSWPPKILRPELIDYVCLIDDRTSFETARFLTRRGLMVGPSSGAVAAACYRVCQEHPRARILGVLADGGERYLTTLFDDDWMEKNGFDTAVNSIRILETASSLSLQRLPGR